MAKKTTFERVRAVVVNEYGADEERVTLETNLSGDLGGDSLDHVEFIMSLEKEFDVDIPDQYAEKVYTVGDAVKNVDLAVSGQLK